MRFPAFRPHLLQFTASAALASRARRCPSTVPVGWTDSLSASSMTLAPGAQDTATLSVTSTGDASGSYPLDIYVNDVLESAHYGTGSGSYIADGTSPTTVDDLTATIIDCDDSDCRRNKVCR